MTAATARARRPSRAGWYGSACRSGPVGSVDGRTLGTGGGHWYGRPDLWHQPLQEPDRTLGCVVPTVHRAWADAPEGARARRTVRTHVTRQIDDRDLARVTRREGEEKPVEGCEALLGDCAWLH